MKQILFYLIASGSFVFFHLQTCNARESDSGATEVKPLNYSERIINGFLTSLGKLYEKTESVKRSERIASKYSHDVEIVADYEKDRRELDELRKIHESLYNEMLFYIDQFEQNNLIVEYTNGYAVKLINGQMPEWFLKIRHSGLNPLSSTEYQFTLYKLFELLSEAQRDRKFMVKFPSTENMAIEFNETIKEIETLAEKVITIEQSWSTGHLSFAKTEGGYRVELNSRNVFSSSTCKNALDKELPRD